MACLLLVCFYYLSREAAITSSDLVTEKKEKIVIDPGHGGVDPGMVGINGLEEKDFNLDISLRLRKALEKENYQVVLTRERDEGLYDDSSSWKKVQDMQRRILKIAEEKPSLAVSIHQNSYEMEQVCGPQVFYYTDSIEGEKLAGYVQERLNQIPGVLRQREKKGNTTYYLLKRSPAVCIIVECGFLTNRKETELLQTEAYREEIANAVKNGIRDYLCDKET